MLILETNNKEQYLNLEKISLLTKNVNQNNVSVFFSNGDTNSYDIDVKNLPEYFVNITDNKIVNINHILEIVRLFGGKKSTLNYYIVLNSRVAKLDEMKVSKKYEKQLIKKIGVIQNEWDK